MKKYGKKRFSELVNGYFDSISVNEQVNEKYATGETTAKGEPVYAVRGVVSDLGKPICIRRWYAPPSVSGLCLYLGITRTELCGYGSDKRYSRIFSTAELMFDSYAKQLMHDGKQAQGLLSAQEFGTVCGTAESGGTSEMSLEERERLLRLAFLSASEKGDEKDRDG